MTPDPPAPTDDPNTPAGQPKPPAADTAPPARKRVTSQTPAPTEAEAGTPTPAPAATPKPPASTSPTASTPAGAKASEADTESIPVVGEAAVGAKAADGAAAGTKTAGGKGPGRRSPLKVVKGIKWRRNPWVTVGSVVVVLMVIAAVGYFAGLGPLNRLNTARDIEPPAKLAGLDRITDEEIRGQLQLDQTREALSRINDGKQATVEAYGDISGSRMFIVIALRGKVDIDKTIKDSGAPPDLVKVVGQSTCVESTDNLPTQCYRGSNTLTVIAQSANEGVGVDTVGPVADEAFAAMK